MTAVLAKSDSWRTKLSKLVPAEVTGLFLSVRGILIGQSDQTYLNYQNEIITITFIVLGIYLIVSKVFGVLHWIAVYGSLILWIALIDSAFANNPFYSIVPLQLAPLQWVNAQLSSTTDIAIASLAWLTVLPLIPQKVIDWYPRVPLKRWLRATGFAH